MSSASAALLSSSRSSRSSATASAALSASAYRKVRVQQSAQNRIKSLRRGHQYNPPVLSYCVYSDMKPFLLPMDKVSIRQHLIWSLQNLTSFLSRWAGALLMLRSVLEDGSLINREKILIWCTSAYISVLWFVASITINQQSCMYIQAFLPCH